MMPNIPTARFYVYALCYPDGRPFYIGKGSHERMHMHEIEANQQYISRKHDIIRHIWASGEEVLKRILFSTDDEQSAYQEEKRLIALHENLSNGFPLIAPNFIDRTQYSSMTLRRMPTELLGKIQSRLAVVNEQRRAERKSPLSQEVFTLSLLETVLLDNKGSQKVIEMAAATLPDDGQRKTINESQRRRGRPRKPIDRSSLALMTIRRFPINLLTQLQSRLADIKEHHCKHKEPSINQEEFVVKLLAVALEKI